MATDQNPYQAYTDGVIYSDNPLNLVVALYEGALDATHRAESAVRDRDILGRGKAINKAIAILSELIGSLDHERGGDISYNLKRLYGYMQVQLTKAHQRQSAEPIVEVSALLATLLEGWRVAAAMPAAAPEPVVPSPQPATTKPVAVPSAEEITPFYGGFLDDSASAYSNSAYSL